MRLVCALCFAVCSIRVNFLLPSVKLTGNSLKKNCLWQVVLWELSGAPLNASLSITFLLHRGCVGLSQDIKVSMPQPHSQGDTRPLSWRESHSVYEPSSLELIKHTRTVVTVSLIFGCDDGRNRSFSSHCWCLPTINTTYFPDWHRDVFFYCHMLQNKTEKHDKAVVFDEEGGIFQSRH